MLLGHTDRHRDSVGCVVPCAEVRIMDEAGREVPPGEAGEVWIKGPTVVPGYLANDTATGNAFVAGFWRSGDIGTIDAAGYIRVLDRLKDMINRAGDKVFSTEVEDVLSRHPQIVEAAVVAHPDPALGERVHAFVTARAEGLSDDGEGLSDDGERLSDEGERLSDGAARAFCRARLADYEVPELATVTTEPLPRNAVGKLQQDVLRRRIGEMIA